MTNTTFNPIRNLALAFVASASILGFAAVPAEASEVREARIAVGQYELTRAEGRQAVEGRVRTVALELCAEGGVDFTNPTEVAAYRLCVSTALRDARQQMAVMTSRTQLAAAQ